MAVKCNNFGGAHPSWDCSKPKNRSHAVGPEMDAKGGAVLSGGDSQRDEAGATPVLLQVATDTLLKPSRGRPKNGFDKTSYMKEYMRKKRAEKKKDDHGSR